MNESQSKLDPELIDAYRSTRFQVFLDDTIITLRIGEKCESLRHLFQKHAVDSACYATAYNPFGRLLSKAENEARNENLRSVLEEKYVLYEGLGVDPVGKWEGEQSFLVLGISFDETLALAKKYEQNAVVYVNHTLDVALELIR